MGGDYRGTLKTCKRGCGGSLLLVARTIRLLGDQYSMPQRLVHSAAKRWYTPSTWSMVAPHDEPAAPWPAAGATDGAAEPELRAPRARPPRIAPTALGGPHAHPVQVAVGVGVAAGVGCCCGHDHGGRRRRCWGHAGGEDPEQEGGTPTIARSFDLQQTRKESLATALCVIGWRLQLGAGAYLTRKVKAMVLGL